MLFASSTHIFFLGGVMSASKLFLPFCVSICLYLFLFLPLSGSEYACECENSYSGGTSVFEIPPPPINSQEMPSVFVLPNPQNNQEKVIRAAIDIGSGATKLRVAEVNLKTHKIERILVNESFPVQYQEHLSKSTTNTFDEEVMKSGLEAIKKSKQIALQNHAMKLVAVATASFRKAANSQKFIDQIYKETGVPIYIIDQDLEGKLAFNAVLSQGHYDPHKLVVWDIGGGSLQLTAKEDGHYLTYRGALASIEFKNLMIKDVQHKDSKQVSTPNPMSLNEIQQGVIKAREIASKVDRVFKDRIHQPGAQIVGVGNIFAYGIYPAVNKKNPYNQQDLENALKEMANQNDQQLGGGDYANVQVSNALLVLGYMQALNIPNVFVLDINNADGALLYNDFWMNGG